MLQENEEGFNARIRLKIIKTLSWLQMQKLSMSIIKKEIPILEFDTEYSAVINPTHEKLEIQLPKKCVFAFRRCCSACFYI